MKKMIQFKFKISFCAVLMELEAGTTVKTARDKNNIISNTASRKMGFEPFSKIAVDGADFYLF